jgi:hypothetical protein
MTAPDPITRDPAPMAGTVVSRAGSGICVRLAVSGWRIRWRLQPDDRTAGVPNSACHKRIDHLESTFRSSKEWRQ